MKLTPPADWPTPNLRAVPEPWPAQLREHEAEWLAQSIRTARLTLLYGEAGCGKTGLLRSGLMPRLRRRAEDFLVPNDADRSVSTRRFERRGADASHRLEVAVLFNAFNAWNVSPLPNLQGQMHAALCEAGAKIPRYRPSLSASASRDSLADCVWFWSTQLGLRFLIILDQFDRYLEAPFDRPGNREFADELVLALNNGSLPVNFLIAVRDDAEPKLDRFRSRIPGFDDNCLRLPPPGIPTSLFDLRNPLAPNPAVNAASNGVYPWERREGVGVFSAARAGDRPAPNLKLHLATPLETPAQTPTEIPAEPPAESIAPDLPSKGGADGVMPSNPASAEAKAEMLAETARLETAPKLRGDVTETSATTEQKALPMLAPVAAETSATAIPLPGPDRRPEASPSALVWLKNTARLDARAHLRLGGVLAFGLVLWAMFGISQRTAVSRDDDDRVAVTPPAGDRSSPSMPKPDTSDPGSSGLAADAWMARDLARFVAPAADVDLRVMPSADGLAAPGRPALSIVSYDAIRPSTQGTAADKPTPGNAAAQVVTPLFTREIGFLVRADSPLRYLHELRGRRIGAGPRGSDARLTVERLYADLFKIPLAVVDASDLAGREALAALLEDRSIDAVAVIEAQPVQWLLDLPPATRQSLRLLKLDAGREESRRALRDYLPARIRAANYPGWLGDDVPTVSVMSFLIAANSADASTQAELGVFAGSLCRNLPQLRAEGHPKWREVQLGLELATRWPYSQVTGKVFRDCAQSTAAVAAAGVSQP